MTKRLALLPVYLALALFFQSPARAGNVDFVESLQIVWMQLGESVGSRSHDDDVRPFPPNAAVQAVTQKLRSLESQARRATDMLDSFDGLLWRAYRDGDGDRSSEAKQELKKAIDAGISDIAGFSSGVDEAVRNIQEIRGPVNDADASALFLQAAAVSQAGSWLSQASRQAASSLRRFPKTSGKAPAFDVYAERLSEGTPELMRLANKLANGNRGGN